jgi:hypothetical protein
MRNLVVVMFVMACLACGRAAYSKASPLAPAPSANPGGVVVAGGAPPIATQIPEQLVIEGSLAVEVNEIGDVMPALRAHVEQVGGRVINEAVTGAEQSWSAQLKLRIPPDKVEDIAGFLAKRGEIVSKHITATDVSKQLFDQELALKTLRATLDRLTQLMAQGGLKIEDVLRVEQEMTRLRGQIEQLEGDQRFVRDRVALATLDISMSRRAGAVSFAAAKAYPGARAAALVLFDPGTRARTRFGGGLVVHTVLRAMSLELDLFQKEPNAGGTASHAAALATIGGAIYSDFLGYGQRRTLNPYLGLRIGYGYLDDHRFVAQGEAGVELWKTRNAMVDVNLRMTGLFGKDTDLGLVAGVGAVLAF